MKQRKGKVYVCVLFNMVLPTDDLKCGYTRMKCSRSVRCTSDSKTWYGNKNEKSLVNIFVITACSDDSVWIYRVK